MASHGLLFAFIAFLLLSILSSFASAETRNYTLRITSDAISADCYPYKAPTPSTIFINGQFPGPPLYAVPGDTVIVRVENELPEGQDITIHFHGIRQYGTPFSDGTPFVAQNPIAAGKSYVQVFHVLDQIGTYFYHAHVGLKSLTAYGPLILYDQYNPPFDYEYHQDKILMLGQWYHAARGDQEDALFSATNFTFPGDPDSYLINGRGIYSSKYASASGCKGYDVTEVEPGKTYRFRLIGTMDVDVMGFAIKDHTLTIIEVDGNYIEPVETDFVEVAPGQRYSVLFKADQKPGNYYIRADPRWLTATEYNGFGIIHYRGASEAPTHIVPHTSQLATYPPLVVNWIQDKFRPLKQEKGYRPPVADVPSHADQTIILKITTQDVNGTAPKLAINNISYQFANNSILLDLYSGKRSRHPDYQKAMNNNGFDSSRGTYLARKSEVIDIVVQSTVLSPVGCDYHPWHTHGHFHWMVAHGNGTYNHTEHADLFNVRHPFPRDTSIVYPTEFPSDVSYTNVTLPFGQGCGWAKLRVLFDNPGVWNIHCHITPHMLMGMQVVMEVGVDHLPPFILKDYLH
ncbi:Cupredoxin [Endogone sp. FLAS-F59071]|nr:Cupredoxin [Endogone sp. FLAS-F59071]|eukprot:RUS15032.1 Cupredoxin [Endogone sp. FLAS-F59071]